MYFPGDGRRFPWMTFYQSEANLTMMGPNFFGMDLAKVIGLAYWGMIDYIGESHGWPAKGWDGGVFNTALRPKPKAWLVKAMFSDQPTVHIGIVDQKGEGTVWNGVEIKTDNMSDHWNRTAGKKYTLYTYTNADEVELFLNGRSLGRKRNATDADHRDQIRWDNVTYEPGTLEAVAYNNGRVVARHKIRTAGEPRKLTLTADKSSWKADGIDLMHVRVAMVDKQGTVCSQADNMLTIIVDGDAEIVAVDNGNIVSDEPFTGNCRSLYRGEALVVLRAGTKGGKVVLKATDGHRSGSVRLDYSK